MEDDDSSMEDDDSIILSQDIFCTPDYLTPEDQSPLKGFHCPNPMGEEEDPPCPRSPKKRSCGESRIWKMDGVPENEFSYFSSIEHEPVEDLGLDFAAEEVADEESKPRNYVSRSAILLRCKFMPPPCIRNPCLKDSMAIDPFENQRSKCAGLFRDFTGGDSLPRYRNDFHEIEVGKALQFIHEKGIAHLDVKPDNIYVKGGVYKLGDFGCATLLDSSLPIEEGDARYMPREILNENYDHLDKVDIFSLGASIYELIQGSPLPKPDCYFNLADGKLPRLPGVSLQFHNLLKVMTDPDPVKRPSARELVENQIFKY